MKVLALADGSSSHTERFVKELKAQGAETLLASAQSGSLVDRPLPRNGALEFQVYRNLAEPIRELVAEFKPDIVSAHFATAYGYAAARTRRKNGALDARWCLHVWGSDILVSPQKSYLHKRRVRDTLAQFDLVFADSSYLAEVTRELGGTQLAVIPWGCESGALASVEQVRSREKLFADRPVRLFAPRPHEPVYRTDLILRELAPLLSAGTATLTTPRVGSLLAEFEKLSERLQVRQHVQYYDHLIRSEYMRELEAHHFYLSAAQSDSAPVSLTEAMAVGVTPLVADHPGLHDLLSESARKRCCFDAQIKGDLRAKLQSLMNLKATDRTVLALENREIVADRAVYENNIAETLQRFNSLLQQRRAIR